MEEAPDDIPAGCDKKHFCFSCDLRISPRNRQYMNIGNRALFDTNLVWNQIFININCVFIWIGNPNNCLAEQAAAGVFFLTKDAPFLKNRVLGPQALFTAVQMAAGTFFLGNDMPFLKRSV